MPAGYTALEARRASQRPVAGLQNWLAMHWRSAQGTGKQPATQVPPTQVSLSGHPFPAQGSAIGTHLAWHCVPALHMAAPHGSA